MMKKNKLKVRFLLSFTLILFVLGPSFGQNESKAKTLLDKVSATMSSYRNLSMDFSYVLDNKAEDVKQEMTGDVVLKGDKYVVNLFGSTQLYDGSKTYTIIPENEEVNISDEDLDEANTFTPSKFYSFYESGYTFSMSDKESIAGKKIQFVKLTPIDTASEVSAILVGIDKKTNHIYQIIEIGKNQTRTILTASNIRVDQEIDESLFTFDEKKYKDLDYMINK